MQEWQYCHLHFSCAIKKVLVKWSLQPSNVMLLHPLISNFTFTNILCCKEKRKQHIYMGIQSWQKCQSCQFCAFVKNPNRKQSESSHKEKRFLLCMERDVAHMFMSSCRVIENDFSVCAVDCLVMSIEVFDRYTQLKSKAPILCT